MNVGERGRVLIVDDEILIRQGIKHYLNWELEGFGIVGEASNGEEALELIEKVNPHIIITDIVMPIMDGEELTKIVKKRYPQIEIIILSSFGEFDYVRSTFQSGVVDYILKPKLDAHTILKALNKAVERIPALQMIDRNKEVELSVEQVIQKSLSGYGVQYGEEITEKFPHSVFCLLGVTLKNGEIELSNYIKEKILSEFSEEEYSFHFYQNIVLINGEDYSKIIDHIRKIGNLIRDYGFVLSERFTDFSQVGVIYKESLVKLLNYRFYFSEEPLLIRQNLPSPAPTIDEFNLDWFTGEIKRKNFNSAFIYLNEHVTALAGCYTLDEYEYKAFFGNVIFNITVLLGNMGYESKHLDQAKYSYFKSIDDAQNSKEVIKQLNEFIDGVEQCIDSYQKLNNDNFNRKKLLQYIKNHYADPLTLTDVAKYFHFNPSYLSSYFSSHKGEGFIEYLNRVRIEEASKLLIEGSTTISEISRMVGYSDHSYFCKVFKKMTGLSPSQYRRKQNTK